MFAQHLVLLGATNLRNAEKGPLVSFNSSFNSCRFHVKAVSSPQVNKERIFHAYLLVESFCHVFQKYLLRQSFRLSIDLNLFLIFHQISGSFSYKIVLIRERVYNIGQTY